MAHCMAVAPDTLLVAVLGYTWLRDPRQLILSLDRTGLMVLYTVDPDLQELQRL